MENDSRRQSRITKSAVEILTSCQHPFELGGALFGMVEIGMTPENERTVQKLRRALRLRREQFEDWRMGLMPDHRIVLVERGLKPTTCAKCDLVTRKWGTLFVGTPMEPLPPEVAERILKRMLRNVDWDDIDPICFLPEK